MGFILKDSGGGGEDFAPLSAGAHVARCVAFIDLGTQESEYQGKVNHRRKVRITWEVPGERMTDGRPFVISKSYTASLTEKANLRADLEGWRNKKFTQSELAGWDASQLLGKACQLSVVHEEGRTNGKTYAVIRAIMPLAKGMACEPQENPSVFFSLDDFDKEVFEALPKFAKEMVSRSPEYQEAVISGMPAHARTDTLEDDDVPF